MSRKLNAGFQRYQLRVVQAVDEWMQVYVYNLDMASSKRDCKWVLNVLSSNSPVRHCKHSGEFG
jgi:hypothetical protein